MSETLGILLIEGRGGLARALLSSRTDLHITHVDRMAKAIALSAPARAAGSISALLVDLSLPDCQGLEAFRRAATLLPGTPIVALMQGHDEGLARSVLAEGAQACLEHDGLDGGALAQALKQAVLRKQVETRRFRAICDSAPMGILLAAGRRVLMANPAAQELLGFSEAEFAGVSVLDLFPAAARPILEAALDAGAVAIPESRFTADMTRKDETSLRCRVHVSGATFNDAPAVALWLDGAGAGESSSPASRDPVRQARKMEALGRLAGGVAHDFNNLLTAINGYSEHLLTLPGAEGPIASGLKAIKRAGESAAAMTRGLMGFSRTEGGEARPVAVDRAIREMAPMLQRLLGGIDFRVRTGAGDASVNLEPGQLEQLILNLCVNARDAMPKGGALSLSTGIADVGAGDAFTHLAPHAGQHVEISVEDTGTGMGPETLESLFEPFYTTKRGGRGTGLGLATVYSIVSQAGGGIGVASEPGAGSRFRIVLARNLQAAAAGEARPVTSFGSAPGGGGGGKVLVVEDEPSLREMILTILGRYGFELLEAASAADAEEIVAASPQDVDLVVTDVMLRGEEGGHELAATLQALKPGLRTLFISGHSLDSLQDRGINLPADAFLEKPFSPAQLAARVRQLMEASRKAG